MTDENVKSALSETSKLAEKLFGDKEKTRSFLNDVEGKLDQFPKLENVMDDVKTVIDMLKDVVGKRYNDLPFATIASLLGALMYLFKKRDLIPDSVPVAGQLDDLAVMALALKLSKGDIEKYRNWRADSAS
jgi:uncharacterized membrane protein YkvA (DUF1232 family)